MLLFASIFTFFSNFMYFSSESELPGCSLARIGGQNSQKKWNKMTQKMEAVVSPQFSKGSVEFWTPPKKAGKSRGGLKISLELLYRLKNSNNSNYGRAEIHKQSRVWNSKSGEKWWKFSFALKSEEILLFSPMVKILNSQMGKILLFSPMWKFFTLKYENSLPLSRMKKFSFFSNGENSLCSQVVKIFNSQMWEFSSTLKWLKLSTLKCEILLFS